MPALSVFVCVRFGPAARASRFSIRVQGLNGVVPLVVRFPRMAAIAQQESEVLAVPYWMGEKTTRARQLLSPASGQAQRREFSYPGLLSMQCMAFYREDGPGLSPAIGPTAASGPALSSVRHIPATMNSWGIRSCTERASRGTAAGWLPDRRQTPPYAGRTSGFASIAHRCRPPGRYSWSGT
jgi:hypothetical protein